MAKMKRDSWGESFKHEPGKMLPQHRPEQEIYLAPEMESDMAEWDNDEFYDDVFYDEEYDDNENGAPVYADEAHEALNRLHQKTNKRGKLMRQPKRAESWQ